MENTQEKTSTSAEPPGEQNKDFKDTKSFPHHESNYSYKRSHANSHNNKNYFYNKDYNSSYKDYGNYHNYNNYNNYQYNINLYYGKEHHKDHTTKDYQNKDYQNKEFNKNFSKENTATIPVNDTTALARNNSVSYSNQVNSMNMNSTTTHAAANKKHSMNLPSNNNNFKKKKRNTNKITNNKISQAIGESNNYFSNQTANIHNVNNAHNLNNVNNPSINPSSVAMVSNNFTNNSNNSNITPYVHGNTNNLNNQFQSTGNVGNATQMNMQNNIQHFQGINPVQYNNTNSYYNNKDKLSPQVNLNTGHASNYNNSFTGYNNFNQNTHTPQMYTNNNNNPNFHSSIHPSPYLPIHPYSKINSKKPTYINKPKSPTVMKKLIFVNQYNKCVDFSNFKFFCNLNLKFLKQSYKFKEAFEEEAIGGINLHHHTGNLSSNMTNIQHSHKMNMNSIMWNMMQMQNMQNTMQEIRDSSTPSQGGFFHNPYLSTSHPPSQVEEVADYPKEPLEKTITENMSTGRFLQGVIRINKCHTHGYITVQGLDNDILIRGNRNLNQSLHSDEVIVELFPMMCWKPLYHKKPRRASAMDSPEDEEDSSEKANRFKETFESQEERLKYINKVYNLRPEGRIVKIHNSPNMEKSQIVKIIVENSLIFAFPIDENIPKIFIKMKKFRRVEFVKKLENDNYFKNKYFLVKIVGWALNFKCPKGIIVNELGNCGDVEVESDVLLKTHEIDYDEDYSNPEELEKLNKLCENFAIDEEILSKRVDLRNEIIFTIDPKTSKDLDDAISVELIDEATGLLEIGVHIADPSHFVTEGSYLDKEAIKRVTTVYLVHKNLPMLPRKLSEDLCSLLPFKDRLAFSLKFRIFFSGALDVTFQPQFFLSVINSSAKWSYELVQRIIDGEDSELIYNDLKDEDGTKPKTKEIFTAMVDKVKMLQKLTKLVRFQRIESGSLIMENEEVKFVLNQEIDNNCDQLLKNEKLTHDENNNTLINSEITSTPQQGKEEIKKNKKKSKYKDTDEDFSFDFFFKKSNINSNSASNKTRHFPLGFKIKSKLDSNNLIEELMLIANKLTAEYLYENLKEEALIRKHALLNETKYLEIQRYLTQNKLTIDFEDTQALNSLLMKIKANNFNKYICIQHKLRSFMQRADYVISGSVDFEDLKHSALNFDLYTHFTSPIRRYPDLVVHRQLKFVLSKGSEKVINYSKYVEDFNEKYSRGKTISNKCQKIFHCILLQNSPCLVYKALVVDVIFKPNNNKNKANSYLGQSGPTAPTISVMVFVPELNVEITFEEIRVKVVSDDSIPIDLKCFFVLDY